MYSILVYRYCTVFLDHTVTLVNFGRPAGRPPEVYECHSTSINTVLYMYSILVYMYCTVLLDHTVTLVQIGRPVARPPDLYECHSTSINTVLYMYTAGGGSGRVVMAGRENARREDAGRRQEREVRSALACSI
eukprot:COSAG05_NODE_6802_length_900_cov_2.283396_1_plen_133_part_00